MGVWLPGRREVWGESGYLLHTVSYMIVSKANELGGVNE